MGKKEQPKITPSLLKKVFDYETVASWEAPKGEGAPIITMPNVPKQLFGHAPRTILGQSAWDKMRKRCYFDADYKCQICGKEVVGPDKQAHELYSYYWKNGLAVFERVICCCRDCHNFIHSGRMQSLYKAGSPLMSKEHLLNVVEHGFKLISAYNKEHPEEEVRAYGTILSYLRNEDLREPVSKLINKYGIKFYGENENHTATWSDWRLRIDDVEYAGPFKSREEWEEKMKGAAEKDTARQAIKIAERFSGGVYDELNEILGKEGLTTT